MVFADTSGLFALLARDDSMHTSARAAFDYLAQQQAGLLTSSYVLVETIALLQRRIGLLAVQDFQTRIAPLLEFVWVDTNWHDRAMQRLVMSNRRDLSLVACLSFVIIEVQEIKLAFAFDKHFEEQGIKTIGRNRVE